MKNTITILGLILLISFTPDFNTTNSVDFKKLINEINRRNDSEKKYHFEFNDAQLNALWNCIDNSNAPHSQVKEVEAMIQQQLKGQLDTTKKK